MKTLLKLAVVLVGMATFAQGNPKVNYVTLNNGTVKATYYLTDNNNIISKEGFFNKNGKLHGTWISYDLNGNKTAIANYKNGKKEGIWKFFKTNKINIVTYKNNKIVSVEEKSLAIN